MRRERGRATPSTSKTATPVHPRLALVAILVFASGCAALVFQIAWMRELRLVFGATTAATSAVLAIFMAGLGIGSAWLGRLADRVANPLRMYGLLEMAIALSTACTPWLVALSSGIYLRLGGQETLGITGATAVRLALAAAIMAVPTILMGGTLPAAVRAITLDADVRRRALGVLYGSNTLGAVFGAAVTTFFALELLGTRATLLAGCAVGLLAGLVAVGLSRTTRTLASRPPAANEGAGKEQGFGPVGLLYLTAAVLGFVFFALELVWYRMLGPILGGTAFTFGLVLCVALLGIGAGGIAYHVLFRRVQPSWSALAVTCGLEGVLTIVPFAVGDRLALMAAWRNESATSFGQLILGWTLITSIVVLPVALVAGIQFPLIVALLGRGRAAVSRHLGMAYAANTVGAIAGTLAAGFGGMPLVTAPGLWQSIAVGLAVLSIGVLFSADRVTYGVSGHARQTDTPPLDTRPPIAKRPAILVACLGLLTIAIAFSPGPTAVWRHSGIGAGRALVPTEPNLVRQWCNERRHALIWEAEGIESSIGLLGQNGLSFVVNGKSDGNSLEDAPTQIGLSILAAVLHKQPRTALVIGLGTGETAGWLAQMRDIEHVDVVELEPAIDAVVERCRDVNWDALHHPRIRRIYNDGREFVFSTDNQYDIIISEPSNPFRAGVAALYTSEFYQALRQRLKPGGLFIQWLQAYEVDAATVHAVIATARSAFDYVEMWQTLAVDLQLVCSATPIEYSLVDLQKRIGSDAVREALAVAWHVRDTEAFLGHFVANSGWADAIARVPLIERNTDDRTLLEYSFAKMVGRESSFSVEALRDELRTAGYDRPPLADNGIDWNRVELCRQEFNFLFNGQLSFALLKESQAGALVEALSRYRRDDFAGVVELWPAEYRNTSDPVLQLILARSYAELARPETMQLLATAEEAYPADAAAVRAVYRYRAGSVAESAHDLEDFFTMLRKTPWVIPAICETAFARTVDVAKASPSAAQRLYPMLSTPFASRRFDYLREVTRILVAREIGAEDVVEALAGLEPNVPWTAQVLELRAQAYAATQHPLARRAERDWQRYQAHRAEK